MRFKLVTPERVLFEEEVRSVTLPTTEGEITVLPHHQPLVAMLKAGAATLTRMDGQTEDVAVSTGFVQIADHHITVLADTAERGEDLTLETIREAQDRAAELMKQARFSDDTAYASAAAAMERELARHRTVVRHRQRRGHPLCEQDTLPHDQNST
jgi:F-type H+-transporting ATPase subunit epsilon